MWQTYRVGTQNYLYHPSRKMLVDCGPGKDQARKLKRAAGEIQVVLLTHAHADHYGGMPYLLSVFPQLTILVDPRETPFLRDPVLEPALLFGGLPPRALSGPFLLGPGNLPFQELHPALFPEIEFIHLPGHTPGLLGIAMDETLFTSDALFGLEIVEKYPILYHFNPEEALQTLRSLPERFTTFLPAHGSQGGKELLQVNINALERVFEILTDTVSRRTVPLETLLRNTMVSLSPVKTMDHYFLNRSALLGYVSALERRGSITLELRDGEILVYRS